jgi:DNA-binding NtrC family response regulator
VARAIHIQSERSHGAFVPIHCAALPGTLLENELFGHEAGAFTGATERKRGLIEKADGGTLFLDEVSEIDVRAQVKLLRFLQERELTPLGSTEPIEIDLRVIAATNQNLEKLVAEGTFREDLYWRLNVVPIHLPPLRERREDIPVLVAHFLERFAVGQEHSLQGFTLEAMIALSNHGWPGNVRELENTIERLVVLHAGKTILDVGDLPAELRASGEPRREGPTSYQEALDRFERSYLDELLHETEGNISQAARLAGISRPNFHRKVRQHGLDPDRYRG